TFRYPSFTLVTPDNRRMLTTGLVSSSRTLLPLCTCLYKFSNSTSSTSLFNNLSLTNSRLSSLSCARCEKKSSSHSLSTPLELSYGCEKLVSRKRKAADCIYLIDEDNYSSFAPRQYYLFYSSRPSKQWTQSFVLEPELFQFIFQS